MTRTNVCVFAAQEDLETMQAFAQVFNKLIRRYKYLEKGFEDEVKKLLLFLKGFSESERNKLAMLTGILLANGTLNASILNSLYNENLVKEGKCGSAPPLETEPSSQVGGNGGDNTPLQLTSFLW